MAKSKNSSNDPARIIIKFNENVSIPPFDENNKQGQEFMQKLLPSWNSLKEKFPGITMGKLFVSVSYDKMKELANTAKSFDPNYKAPLLRNFYWIDCPAGIHPEKLIVALSKTDTIELAYEEGESIPAFAINAAPNPKAEKQNYLDPSPTGIDAKFAWNQPGGDGRSPVKIIDIEQGWYLHHKDLPAAGSLLEIKLSSGVNNQYLDHGTSVLGIIAAQDNDKGVVGITPSVKAEVVSNWRDDTHVKPNDADAITFAITRLQPGDILLIESQRDFRGKEIPIETNLAVFHAIELAVKNGITVIEPAGNFSVDLDNFEFSHGMSQGRILPEEFYLRKKNEDTNDTWHQFTDSGAIMVGCSVSDAPHARLDGGDTPSNYGSRIDCYAWGEEITTTNSLVDRNATLYTSAFGGTSGAAAIVAGAAIAIQSMAIAAGKHPFMPTRLREILSDRNINTKSGKPADDKIGVMPDLKSIFQNVIDV